MVTTFMHAAKGSVRTPLGPTFFKFKSYKSYGRKSLKIIIIRVFIYSHSDKYILNKNSYNL